MKKNFFLLLFLSAVQFLPAQVRMPDGVWEGHLQVGVSLRMVFHISTDSAGKISATMDSPDQGAYGIACGRVWIAGDSLHIEVPVARGSFSGRITTDSLINGQWKQGRSFPLQLHKTNKISAPSRPQTPRPPFPYLTDSVTYKSPLTGLEYGATLSIPKGKGPFPAIILITGSGPQNRDEEIFGHHPFAVLADYLTRMGFIVLRADDRGVGQSSGSFFQATSADFARDAEAHLDYLLKRDDVDRKRIGLMGHSEGGMIAPMLADKRKEISFVVLLAGPGVPIAQLMTAQNEAILLKAGIRQEAVQAYGRFYRQAVPEIALAPGSDSALNQFTRRFNEWKASVPSNYVLAVTGVYNDSTEKKFCQAMVTQIYNPWFRYFISFNPVPYLEKLRGKVLAVNGSQDIQVIPELNLSGIKAALEQSHVKEFEVKELPGLNHLFQECRSCTLSEYGQLEQTISPLLLQELGNWLRKEIL